MVEVGGPWRHSAFWCVISTRERLVQQTYEMEKRPAFEFSLLAQSNCELNSLSGEDALDASGLPHDHRVVRNGEGLPLLRGEALRIYRCENEIRTGVGAILGDHPNFPLQAQHDRFFSACELCFFLHFVPYEGHKVTNHDDQGKTALERRR